jgi:hypothetical protein
MRLKDAFRGQQASAPGWGDKSHVIKRQANELWVLQYYLRKFTGS